MKREDDNIHSLVLDIKPCFFHVLVYQSNFNNVAKIVLYPILGLKETDKSQQILTSYHKWLLGFLVPISNSLLLLFHDTDNRLQTVF